MKKLLLGSFVAAALLLGACSSTAGEEDAPVGKRNEAPRTVWVMSDEFPNLEGVCIGGDLVLVTRQGGRTPIVLPQNKECAS